MTGDFYATNLDWVRGVDSAGLREARGERRDEQRAAKHLQPRHPAHPERDQETGAPPCAPASAAGIVRGRASSADSDACPVVRSARSHRTSLMRTPQTTTSSTGTLCCAGPRRRHLRAGCTTAASSCPRSTPTSRPSSCSCARPGALRSARRSASASRSTTRSSGSRAGTSAQVWVLRGRARCADHACCRVALRVLLRAARDGPRDGR